MKQNKCYVDDVPADYARYTATDQDSELTYMWNAGANTILTCVVASICEKGKG